MRIKLLVSAAAIALVAGLASASAAEKFTTLDGITAQAMTTQAMGRVKGKLNLGIAVPRGAGIPVGLPDQFDNDPENIGLEVNQAIGDLGNAGENVVPNPVIILLQV